MSDQLHDENLAAAIDREQAEKLKEWPDAAAVAYFGGHQVGEWVSVNSELFGEVVEVGAAGVRLKTITGQKIWYPAAFVRSVRTQVMRDLLASNVDNRVVENSREGDESLPMRPPPQQPGVEATFR